MIKDWQMSEIWDLNTCWINPLESEKITINEKNIKADATVSTTSFNPDTLIINSKSKSEDLNRSVFDGIPAARNLEESKASLQQRKDSAIRRNAELKLDAFPNKDSKGNGGISNQADAKLSLGVDIEQINKELSKGKPYAKPGTDFAPLRKGDYDFALVNFTSLLYRQWDNPALKPETRLNLAKNIINEEGKDHIPSRWLLGIVPETENHILMTESTRYLKNQIVQKNGIGYSTSNLKPENYDNSKNGFNNWFVNHLSQFARKDFDEYNSKPYQPYALKAIENLYDYADDPKVKTSAQIVLDYTSAKFALQSSDLRRVVPYRRRPEHKSLDDILGDNQSSRFATLAGNFNAYDKGTDVKDPFSRYHMFTQGISKYEVPDAILDVMVDKSSNPYFMTSHHENTEIVYAENNFLISAGGHFDDWSSMPFTKQENGIPMPTVIMLKDSGPNTNNMIRFLGRGDKSDKINNTGVYENFAFGIRPVLPANLEKELKEKGKIIEKDSFKFMEVDNTYIAMYIKNQPSPGDYAPSIGFAEVVDKKNFASLADFKADIEKNNQGKTYSYYGSNTYTTTKGKTIEFEMAENPKKNFWGNKVPPEGNVTEWPVKRVWEGNNSSNKEIPIERKFEKWQLTNSYTTEKENDGENNDYLMKADGTGQVLINNPRLNKSLLMSLADHSNPVRIEQNVEVINLAETSEIKNNKDQHSMDLSVNLKESDKVGYISLKWAKDSAPADVRLYIKEKNANNWKLAEDRKNVFTSKDYDFRTDFNLAAHPEVTAVKFLVMGKDLKLAGNPEVYKAD
jgi:hypothetical protein